VNSVCGTDENYYHLSIRRVAPHHVMSVSDATCQQNKLQSVAIDYLEAESSVDDIVSYKEEGVGLFCF